MTMTLGHCRDCLYFRVGADPTPERPYAIGGCMRYPPVPVCVRPARVLEPGEDPAAPAEGYKWESVWPTVIGELGCGEFRAREGGN